MHNTLSKADKERLNQQRAEGLYGAMFVDSRKKEATLRKAAGVTAPDPGTAPNRMLSPGEAAAEASRRLGRPESTHERQMRESAEAHAAVMQQIKAMHTGAQSTPSTGPQAL